MEISIRQMEIKDLPEIMDIEMSSFSIPWSATAFINEINKINSLTKVAEFQGKVIGYICINYIFNEAHILNLAVHPDYRRQGIATALMKDALSNLFKKGCIYFYLEVRESNIIAQRFYKKFGFKTVGKRKGYYLSPNEDAIIMMLRL
jgi:ribosomal-protein-alanine N-acetyltransferase